MHVHRSRTSTCRILEVLTKVCPADIDKVEIKCMGSVSGKHQQNQMVCSLFSSLRHLNEVKLIYEFCSI